MWAIALVLLVAGLKSGAEKYQGQPAHHVTRETGGDRHVVPITKSDEDPDALRAVTHPDASPVVSLAARGYAMPLNSFACPMGRSW